MHRALADFRIEGDSVVLLSFTNGRSYRVSPDDLERHLSRDDLAKVRRALRLRKQFLQRILPPTIIIVGLAAVLGLGGYDVEQITADLRAASHHATPQRVIHTLPVPAASSKGSAAPASTQPTTSNSPQSGVVQPHQPTHVAGSSPEEPNDSLASGHQTASSSSDALPGVAREVDHATQPFVQTITQPVTQTISKVIQALPLGR